MKREQTERKTDCCKKKWMYARSVDADASRLPLSLRW